MYVHIYVHVHVYMLVGSVKATGSASETVSLLFVMSVRLFSSHSSVPNGDEEMPYLPPDQTLPSYVLNRRRHAISCGPESAYRSRPRMKRRGAISFERSDTAAEYIRYLGK